MIEGHRTIRRREGGFSGPVIKVCLDCGLMGAFHLHKCDPYTMPLRILKNPKAKGMLEQYHKK